MRAPSGDRGNKFRVETLAVNKSPVETSAAVRFGGVPIHSQPSTAWSS